MQKKSSNKIVMTIAASRVGLVVDLICVNVLLFDKSFSFSMLFYSWEKGCLQLHQLDGKYCL